MRKAGHYLLRLSVVIGALALISTSGFGQTFNVPGETTHEVVGLAPGAIVPDGPFKLRYKTLNLLSAKGKEAVKAQVRGRNTASRAVTVPVWQGAMPVNGPVQTPFLMVGRTPVRGGTTVIPAQLLPIAVVFEGTTDPATGGPIKLAFDAQTLGLLIQGPDFAKAPYGTGTTQFADAVQRAEFFPVERPTWHTLIRPSQLLGEVAIYVPDSVAGTPIYQMYQTSDKTYFATLDYNFFVSQLETIFQLEKTNPRALLIPLVRNLGLTQDGQCCVGGFHDAYEFSRGNTIFVQTFTYATWMDPGVGQAAYGNPSFADILPLSHEISEWLNDPVGSNEVEPPWEYPNSSNCQDNLEVADPIEYFPADQVAFPVTLNSYTYHPQNVALYQWFSQETPSSAIDKAYSYPDESVLTAPSVSCPP